MLGRFGWDVQTLLYDVQMKLFLTVENMTSTPPRHSKLIILHESIFGMVGLYAMISYLSLIHCKH